MTQEQALQIDYDPDVDILYASIGPPRAATTVEIESYSVFVRICPKSHQVVGIEIFDCAKKFKVTHDQITKSFVEDLITRFSPEAMEIYKKERSGI